MVMSHILYSVLFIVKYFIYNFDNIYLKIYFVVDRDTKLQFFNIDSTGCDV